MAADQSLSQPRTDTPNDFREDACDDPNTQVVILVTPLLAPESGTQDEQLDNDAELPSPPAPRVELRHLRVPKTTLYKMLPEPLWTESPITTTLGVPMKIARCLGNDDNKAPNSSMIGFSMLCDFDNLGDFGKVPWTKVLGAVVVAKVDGSDMDVPELTAVIKYVNVLGEELRMMKLQVEEDMKAWDAEMRAKSKLAWQNGEDGMEVSKQERLEVKEAKRMVVIANWSRQRVSKEAFERFRVGLEMGEEDEEGKEGGHGDGGERGADSGGFEDEVAEEGVGEVIKGIKDINIV